MSFRGLRASSFVIPGTRYSLFLRSFSVWKEKKAEMSKKHLEYELCLENSE